MKRIKNKLFALFCAIFTSFALFPATALADLHYSNIGIDIADHIVVRSGFQNAVRSAGYSILKFLASFIDYIYNSVTTIASYNLYTLVQKQFDFKSFFVPLAWAILSLITVFMAIRLMLKSDTRFGEDALKFFICMGLIVIFPAFISACGDMRSKLVSDVDTINVSGSTSQSLGNQILESYVVDVYGSVESGNVVYYNDKTHALAAKDININSVFENTDEFTVKITDDPEEASYFVGKGLYSFWAVISNMKLDDEYEKYQLALESGEIIKELSSITYEGGSLTQHYSEYTAEEYANQVMLKRAKISLYNDWLKQHTSFDGSKYDTWTEYENALDDALNKAIEWDERHPNTAIRDENGNETDLYIANLFNDNEVTSLLNEASATNIGNYFDYLGRYISGMGYVAENVYKYDYEFGYCLITMLAALLSLIFAVLKLGKMLYELVFMEVISPVFIAIDAGSWQGQKTKQVVTNLLTTSAMFAIVILVLKLYLIVLLQIFKISSLSFAVRLVLIIAGAAFVIDGPDAVVKILGMDAGVKSGYGAFRGVGAAARAVTGTARAVGGAAKKIAHAPESVAAKAGEVKAKSMAKKDARNQAKANGKGRIGQMVAGAKAGLSNGRTGTAFKKSVADRARANNEYKDNKDKSSELKEKAKATKNVAGTPITANKSSAADNSSALNTDTAENTTLHSSIDNGTESAEQLTGNSVSSSDSSSSTLGADSQSATDNTSSEMSANTTPTSDSGTGTSAPNSTSETSKRGKGFSNAKSSQKTKYPMQSADETKLFHDNRSKNDYSPPSADKSKLSYDRDNSSPFDNTEYFDPSKEE